MYLYLFIISLGDFLSNATFGITTGVQDIAKTVF